MACDSIAIALGANLGDPLATLIAVRPLVEQALQDWSLQHAAAGQAASLPLCRWSPIFRTRPVGGPPGQPDYLNAAVLLPEAPAAAADTDAPLALLLALQRLETRFGRQRREHWGPRHLDLDLLWCGERIHRGPELELPHPRLQQRCFVLAPLAAIDPALVPPVSAAGGRLAVAAWLERLMATGEESPPLRLVPSPGWPE